MIGCCGGGSNLGGISLPFVPDRDVRLVAVEPTSCPTLTAGQFEYDFGDTAGFAPLLLMYTLGHDFVPPSIHAGGLRYHGDAPIISALVRSGRMEAVAYPQAKTFEAAVTWAARRAPSRHLRPATPSGPSSTRPWRPKKRGRRGSSSSTTRATGCSTSRRTTPTCTGNWWTETVLAAQGTVTPCRTTGSKVGLSSAWTFTEPGGMVSVT